MAPDRLSHPREVPLEGDSVQGGLHGVLLPGAVVPARVDQAQGGVVDPASVDPDAREAAGQGPRVGGVVVAVALVEAVRAERQAAAADKGSAA